MTQYSVVYRTGLLGDHVARWCVKSGVLCHSSSVLLRTHGALESKSRQHHHHHHGNLIRRQLTMLTVAKTNIKNRH